MKNEQKGTSNTLLTFYFEHTPLEFSRTQFQLSGESVEKSVEKCVVSIFNIII
jgi:hypothetical protein